MKNSTLKNNSDRTFKSKVKNLQIKLVRIELRAQSIGCPHQTMLGIKGFHVTLLSHLIRRVFLESRN